MELSLRFLGKVWQHNRSDYQHSTLINKDNNTIACFGDSYTVGGLGTRDLSYPGILNKMTLPNKTTVLNLGICESNSSQVLEAIENYTVKNNSRAIVLLVGAANKYNFYGMKKINFYQTLRIYKMYQIMKLSLVNKFLKKEMVDKFNDAPNSGYYLSNDIEKIFSDARGIDNTYGTLHTINYYLARKNDRLPMQSSFTDSGKERVKELLDGLSEQEKQKIIVDLIPIYSFMGDNDKTKYYYDIAKKTNPFEAKQILVFNCLDKNNNMKEEDKIKIFNELIAEDPYEGYCNIIQFYLNRTVFIKDETEKNRRLKLAKSYLDKLISLATTDDQRTCEILLEYYRVSGEFDKAKKLYEEQFLKKNKRTRFKDFYFKTAYYLVYYGNFSEAVYYFIQAFKQNPRLDLHSYYYFSKAFDLQNKYDAKYVLNEFENISKKYPKLRNNPSFNTCKESFKNRLSFENKVLEWLKIDVEKIIDICKEKNIKLIIQNYPFPYFAVNKTLREISDKYNVTFIDNYIIFSNLVKENGYRRYFLDFDHCTEEGHKIIANNVYSVLIDEKII
ncbi:MAG: hypothetical protein PHH62_04625 [Endomicrobiaceae bacterium]|nr:hypothetical protein [Endomicrobiaceae bacterium]